ncbi:SDR family NAD(P)-dependent oxidoreductase [Jatrophihabitans fulvus]
MSRVTVVIGGTSGIGLAAAEHLAPKGDRIVLVAREGGSFDDAVRAVKAAGAGDVRTIAADVNSLEDMQRVVEQVRADHGRIDAVIHTATVMGYGTVEQMPPEVFETVVNTAVHGTANIARAVLPVLREQGRGVVVFVNSLLGSITVPNMGAYATSKWAQRAVVRTLQQETRDAKGVKICMVSPGSINTPIYYQGANYTGRNARPPVPVLQPDQAGRVIARLLDHPRHHVSVPVGPVNPLAIFGYRFLPAVYDALVNPLFRLAALTSPAEPEDGNVRGPRPSFEEKTGRWPGVLR